MTNKNIQSPSLDAANAVLLFLSELEAHKSLPLHFWLLKALAEKTKEFAMQDVPAENLVFTPAELVEWLHACSDKPINPGNKSAPDYISDLYRKLIKALEDNTRLKWIAAEEQLPFYGKPGKITGGGQKNTNQYRLDAEPVPKQTQASFEKLTQHSVPTGGLRYLEQKELSTPRLIKMLDGFDARGWRLKLLLVFILLPILFFIASLTTPLAVIVFPSLSSMVQPFIFWSIVYLALMIGFFGFLYRLIDKRVAMAPDWMTMTSREYLLLEYRAERNDHGQFSHRKVVLVHYTAKCPVCNGSVTVNKGGWHFIGRLVGRCDENPVEHIFSFDHVTKTGKPLR